MNKIRAFKQPMSLDERPHRDSDVTRRDVLPGNAATICGAVMLSDGIAFGHFRLRVAERLLEKDGVRLKLGSRALDILIALVERAPEVVTKRELLARVWPGLVVDEGSLRFHIAVLRKVLGDGQSSVRFVINVAGRGYCFAAPILRSGAKPLPAESLPAQRIAALPRSIAYDFNNIIGAILGYGALAQNAASADHPVRRYADNIMIVESPMTAASPAWRSPSTRMPAGPRASQTSAAASTSQAHLR